MLEFRSTVQSFSIFHTSILFMTSHVKLHLLQYIYMYSLFEQTNISPKIFSVLMEHLRVWYVFESLFENNLSFCWYYETFWTYGKYDVLITDAVCLPEKIQSLIKYKFNAHTKEQHTSNDSFFSKILTLACMLNTVFYQMKI